MKTLLSLFYIPYLRFLVKFHLVTVPLILMIYVLRLNDLMLLAPMLYPFALYTTINRHQFKENIPWMLATFNKRLLIQYHLFSQTLVMGLLALLSSVGVLIMTIASITLLPKSADKLGASAGEQALSLLSPDSSWMSTKEQVILVVAAIFFLTTLYSPVSLKDHLRQMEESSQKWKKFKFHFIGAGAFLIAAHIWFESLKVFVLPFLSFILVGQIFYIVFMYNRAFTLFHPKHYKKLSAALTVSGVMTLVGLASLSSWRLKHSDNGDQRVAELSFLGIFAPKTTDKEFLALVKGVKDPVTVIEVFKGKRVIPLEAKLAWIKEAKEFGVALEVVKSLNGQEIMSAQDQEMWAHLDTLYTKLVTQNPAAASWRLSALKRHLISEKWNPIAGVSFVKSPVLEQLMFLEWQKKNSPQEYSQSLTSKDIKAEVLDYHLDRKPASETSRPQP